jgi:hypothetical protein
MNAQPVIATFFKQVWGNCPLLRRVLARIRAIPSETSPTLTWIGAETEKVSPTKQLT